MPRKKKKNPNSAQRNEGSVDSDVSSPAFVQTQTLDLLSVRLGKVSRNKKARLPQILVLDQDAALLDLSSDEELILVSRGETTTGAVVARAQVRSNSARRLNATPPQSQIRAAPLSSGTIQVTHSSLVDALFAGCRREEATPSPSASTVPVATTPITLSAPKTPSSEKTSFSFKSGGGGDQLYSPPMPSSPLLRTPNKDKKYASNPLWIVRVLAPFGRRIAQKVCTKASRLVVQPVISSALNDNKSLPQKWKNSLQVLERLVLAHCVERYVQKGEVLQISFQGKPVDLVVIEVKELLVNDEDGGTGGITTELENLQLYDRKDMQWSQDEVAVWDAVTSSNDLRLYKVHYNTQVKCMLLPNSADNYSCEEKCKEEQDTTQRLQPVAGLSKTLDELRSFLQTPLEHPELFARAGLKPPKGVLLYGPSGVGKTCIARQIAVEFQNALCTVEFVNCSSLQSMTAVVGEAERLLSKYFRIQSSDRGKLLIFDDVHLICPRRGGPASNGTDRLAASLLALLDGVSGSDSRRDACPLVVLAITDNPSLLDPALRRSGRLDTEIEVPLPDEPATRVEILKCQIQNLGIGLPDMDEDSWLTLGRLAKGFNGADCSLAVKEAVRCCLLRNTTNSGLTELSGFCGSTNNLDLHVDDLRASIRATKPSAIKSITVEIPQVKWSSIGGMDSVKRELREAIELPLTHQAAFQGLGIPPPRGILLYGPPGCSKTLMARALATEGRMNFLAVKGPELVSKWLGESERALAALFRRARMASPAIIFFDEVDAIATKRGSGDSPSSGRLLSQLLTELDGVNHTGSAAGSKPHRVVVVGATNRPDLLDTALTRPGRIDRMIYVGVPDCESRAKIFELSLQNKSRSDDIDIPRLASDKISHGFSGAEVVAICRDAALLALEECDDPMAERNPKIEMQHLLRAVDGMQRQITPQMLDFYRSYREKTHAA